jgi:hypothetical protein
MCAIDALGMAAMLGRDITITSADPTCGAEIRVELCGRSAVWALETAVVVVGSNAAPTAGQCCPQQGATAEAVAPAAEGCCTVTNFFSSTANAQQWLDAHRDATGVVLDQGQAMRLGVDIFGRLLDE